MVALSYCMEKYIIGNRGGRRFHQTRFSFKKQNKALVCTLGSTNNNLRKLRKIIQGNVFFFGWKEVYRQILDEL